MITAHFQWAQWFERSPGRQWIPEQERHDSKMCFLLRSQSLRKRELSVYTGSCPILSKQPAAMNASVMQLHPLTELSVLKRPDKVFVQRYQRQVYLVGLFLSPILRNFAWLGLKRINVTGEKTHLAATQLSWKLLSKDGHVTRIHPITFNVITKETTVNVTVMKGAL